MIKNDGHLLNDDTWGITCFFNPVKYKNKYQNYRIFRDNSRRQGLKLVAVELTFDSSDFELNKMDAEILLQIRGGKDNILWQKERLLNLALQKLPPECTKVVWIDCDILFNNDNWVSETSKTLDTYKVIQPFQTIVRLNKGMTCLNDSDIEKLPYGNPEMHRRYSCTYSFINNIEPGHEGFVWAGRREILQKYGFYDKSLMHRGDSLMKSAFLGEPTNNIYFLWKNNEFIDDYKKWYSNIASDVHKDVFYVTGNILHLWHGNHEDRGYGHTGYSSFSMEKYPYDPNKDIYLNEYGIWEWSNKNTKLKKHIVNYFIVRNETGQSSIFSILKKLFYFPRYYLHNINLYYRFKYDQTLGLVGIWLKKYIPVLYKVLKSRNSK